MVKTASREYPKTYMHEWFSTSPTRGSFKILQSMTPNNTPMYALCWADRKPKCIISNRGTTLPGADSTLQYERRIERPQIIELFFSKFSTIDVHDHLRQGYLEMERTWHTTKWHHRLFATLFGMVATAAGCRDSSIADFNSFTSQLSYQLIFNDFTMQRSTRVTFSALEQYQRLSGTALRAQRKCGVCGKKASFYCTGCSGPLKKQFFGVCGLKTNRDCHAVHTHSV
ncbi:hypothetical protein PHYSODRAFT_511780 [Phytophthora sojae]|uniref:Uncharacterized protein n=1 Tax=Phytophthora sojae (strain P6497) TaxID=1094619 RepID=G4ZSU7_PHYSP|nr:hypothetical protein PHYSODRAFT_511780 [Phytophthora sojae]EGZ13032.1 hypothetical protein PHYSODRAFT_511780 [Phytophthora sojae]|eukprot:XP_009530461.1 hypothetical protein PHYSODRAFT_511780 [Phytophthora sojae]